MPQGLVVTEGLTGKRIAERGKDWESLLPSGAGEEVAARCCPS